MFDETQLFTTFRNTLRNICVRAFNKNTPRRRLFSIHKRFLFFFHRRVCVNNDFTLARDCLFIAYTAYDLSLKNRVPFSYTRRSMMGSGAIFNHTIYGVCVVRLVVSLRPRKPFRFPSVDNNVSPTDGRPLIQYSWFSFHPCGGISAVLTFLIFYLHSIMDIRFNIIFHSWSFWFFNWKRAFFFFIYIYVFTRKSTRKIVIRLWFVSGSESRVTGVLEESFFDSLKNAAKCSKTGGGKIT